MPVAWSTPYRSPEAHTTEINRGGMEKVRVRLPPRSVLGVLQEINLMSGDCKLLAVIHVVKIAH